MAKLQKAQLGKIVKKVIAPVIKKRSWEAVSGTAAAVGAGTAGSAAYFLNKARKELAADKNKPAPVKQSTGSGKNANLKSGGQTKSKKK